MKDLTGDGIIPTYSIFGIHILYLWYTHTLFLVYTYSIFGIHVLYPHIPSLVTENGDFCDLDFESLILHGNHRRWLACFCL